jgi:predicted TIM-barrel fold metal-dependent hydrolase
MMVDAHHHLWDLSAVNYPWLMEKGAKRFFGDPTPIQRNYLIDEFRAEASAEGFGASVHIQVGAADPMAEAQWVQSIADANPDWPMAQVAFCDLTSPDLNKQLDAYQALSTVRGVRQIVGRAPEEDEHTGTNALLENPNFLAGLKEARHRGMSFDLQLIPELMRDAARVLEQSPDTKVALCHAGSPHDRSPEGLKFWESELRTLSALPHMTCKLSGLGMFEHDWTEKSIKPIVDVCFEQFGPERIMFGSNFPVGKLYSGYEQVASAYRSLIPENLHQTVFHSTASQFYSIGE